MRPSDIGGWGATPKLAAYAAVCIGGVSDADCIEREVDVLAATIHRVYVHGITAMADSVEQMFEYDNAPWGCEAVQPSYHAKGLRSLSVGDLVMEIPAGDGEGFSHPNAETTLYLCANAGWSSCLIVRVMHLLQTCQRWKEKLKRQRDEAYRVTRDLHGNTFG